MSYLKRGLMLAMIALSLTGCAALDQWYEDEYCSTESAYAHGINDAKAYKDMDSHYGNSCPNRNFELLSSYRRGYKYGLRFTEAPQATGPTQININQRVYRVDGRRAPAPHPRPFWKRRHHHKRHGRPVVRPPVVPNQPVIVAPTQPKVIHPVRPARPVVSPIKPLLHPKLHPTPKRMHNTKRHSPFNKPARLTRKGWGCMTTPGGKKVCGLNCTRVGPSISCKKYSN